MQNMDSEKCNNSYFPPPVNGGDEVKWNVMTGV
jgi:hypothetical protein